MHSFLSLAIEPRKSRNEMASKKRKRVPATDKQSGGDRAAKKKKSDKVSTMRFETGRRPSDLTDTAMQALIQTPMPKSSSIGAGTPITSEPSLHSQSFKLNFLIGPAETKAPAQPQCPFFLLPLELRNMIYNYVFDTGAVGKEKHSRVYIISYRRQQRIQNVAVRNNNFKLVNFGHHHFALLKTCRAIHAECKPFFDSKVVYRFTSPHAVAGFLCGGNLGLPQFSFRNLDVLDKAVKVQVMIDPAQHDSAYFYYGFDIVLESLNGLRLTDEPRSLGLTFVDKDNVDGTPGPACEKAQSRLAFDELMHFEKQTRN